MKKFLSVLLAIAMCLSMGTVVFADPDSPGVYSPNVFSPGVFSPSVYSPAVSSPEIFTKAEALFNALHNSTDASGVFTKLSITGTGLIEPEIVNIILLDKKDNVSFTLTGVKNTTVKLIQYDGTKYVVQSAPVDAYGKVTVEKFDSYYPVIVAVETYEPSDGGGGSVAPRSKYSKYNLCKHGDDCILNTFTDLVLNEWYHDGIHYCVENGMMEGVGDGKFNPTGTTTRGMIITMLWRLKGSPVVNYAMNYTDVPAGTWYTEAVRWATAVGVIDGIGDNKCAPEATITREQLATMIYRFEQKVRKGGFTAGQTYALDYPDAASVSNWATEAMQWVVKKGVVYGIAGNLVPVGDASRAEAATMMQRYCTK